MTEDEIKRKAQELLQRPYTMVIRGDPVDGYLAKAPELPYCFTAGETLEEALANLREAMAGWFEAAIAHGSPIPEPEAWAAARQMG